MYYSHKESIVRVDKMNENFELDVFGSGLQLGVPGDYIATKLNGDKFVLPKEYFDELYVPVSLVKKINKSKMTQGYQEMADINKEEAEAGIYTYNDGMFQSNKAF